MMESFKRKCPECGKFMFFMGFHVFSNEYWWTCVCGEETIEAAKTEGGR